jgi:ABC-type sugar transport system permease subunit
MRIYKLAFFGYNLGKATALAIALFLVIMILVGMQRLFFRENLDG